MSAPVATVAFNRRAIETTIETLIGLLDIAEPDPDMEDDDPAGDAELTDDSPGFEPADRRLANAYGTGAGCTLSDPDSGIDDRAEGTLGLDC